MATVIQRLEKLNVDGITAKPPRLMGKAKLVFLEPMMKVSTPKLAQAWPIRPSDDSAEKFTLEVRLDADSETFKTALVNFDMQVRKLALANKKAWFGKAADEIETENDLRQMHAMSIKKGNEKADGTRWEDTVKFKITGWSDYVEEVLYKGEGDKRYPVDVKWKTRSVDHQGQGGPDDSHTKFYICENRDMTTGKEQMAPWTPCQDPAGNQIKDAAGNTIWEFVGPKHCQPGCKLTVVFQPTMVWLASKFGVTLAAKQVFITPAPAKPKNIIEGIEIVDFVDPILASRAAKLAMASDDLRDLEDLPADADDVAAAVDKLVGIEPETTDKPADKPAAAEKPVDKPAPVKRTATLPAEGSTGSKKSKKVKTVDEEF